MPHRARDTPQQIVVGQKENARGERAFSVV
jgi:hypothetical protein